MLLSAVEAADSTQTASKIERLRLLDGGRRIGIILLLDGDQPMTALAKLELECVHFYAVQCLVSGQARPCSYRISLLQHGGPLPVIPISRASELSTCLFDWRRQMSRSSISPRPHEAPKTLVSNCVSGKPLPERQANILMDVFSGFRELAHCIYEPEKREQLENYLGRRDAARLMAFLREESHSADA